MSRKIQKFDRGAVFIIKSSSKRRRKMKKWMLVIFFLLFSTPLFCNGPVGHASLSGHVYTLPITKKGATPVENAQVRICGTDLTETTYADGNFEFSPIPFHSTYMLKVTKEGYVPTYTIPHGIGDENGVEQSIFILTEDDLNIYYSEAEITKDETKGTIIVLTYYDEDSYFYGATGIIKDLNGNDAAESIWYIKEDGSIVNSPIPTSQTGTTGSGTIGFIGFNVKPGPVMVSASGSNFIWRPAFVFPGCVTSGISIDGIFYTDQTVNINGVLQDENDNPVSGATVSLLGTGIKDTTDGSGNFTLENVPVPSIFISKAEKNGYYDTYYLIDEVPEEIKLLILSEDCVNEFAQQAGEEINSEKGCLGGPIRDYYYNPVKDAEVKICDEEGNQSSIDVYYIGSDDEGIDTSLERTSDSGWFAVFNYDPEIPVYMKVEKYLGYLETGSPIGYFISIAFKKGVTITKMDTSLRVGHVEISKGDANPQTSTFSSGATDVRMLHIKLEETTGYHDMYFYYDTIIIRGSGTGDEANDVVWVKIWESNENGDLIGNEPLDSGKFNEDDGKVELHPDIFVPRGETLYLMVTYDFSGDVEPGKTFKASILHNSDVTIYDGSGISGSVEGAPVEGNEMIVETEEGPDIYVNPESVDFGDVVVGSSVAKQITVMNTGTENLRIHSLQISGDNPEQFAIENDISGQTIEPGQSVTLTVKFSPTSSGTKNAVLTIPSNDPDEGEVNITLTGKGIEEAPPSEGGGGGCFIATAAYGSYQQKYVRILREFRDKYLLTNRIGRAFVRFYYRHSPPLAEFIKKHEVAKYITRILLSPVILIAWLTLKGLLIPLLIIPLLLLLRKRLVKYSE